ncbi:hypothetical protein N7532_010561 [Penicillium argentinense]|uniref:Uncharacterized protein n=1 Tax=Penicillium argentinense TaxID=1131581 RepID=A0A9W9EQ18_9EURO|nr:uncharacterized protein N7532_010561 [Penicillium argentinense]KAJ5085790.1 hypothetical protein N7532_010561 [Penicillium argentinense]
MATMHLRTVRVLAWRHEGADWVKSGEMRGPSVGHEHSPTRTPNHAHRSTEEANHRPKRRARSIGCPQTITSDAATTSLAVTKGMPQRR